MKPSKILSALALSLSLPVAVFAAKGNAGVVSIQGYARSSTGDAAPAALETGGTLQEGALLETGSDSGAELALSNGSKLVIIPGSRVRLASLEDSAKPGLYSYEFVLLRGGVRGDATRSLPGATFSIRTGAGKVNVAGSSFAVDYAPTSVRGGNMTVVILKGMASVSIPSSVSPIIVPAGSQTQVGQGAVGGSGVVASAAPEALSSITAVLSGSGARKVTQPAGTSKPAGKAPEAPVSGAALPDFSVMGVISPNGEGAGI